MTADTYPPLARPLSREGVSALGMGCSRVGSLTNTASPEEIRQTLVAAFESGVTVFDTANIYGQGDSERMLGKLFAREPGAFIVTKAGYRFSWKARAAAKAKPLIKPVLSALTTARTVTDYRQSVIGKDFAPTAIRASLEGSLRRLKRETVSGFLLHDPPPEAIGSQAVWDLLKTLKREGKAARVGASIQTLADLEAVADNTDCELVQAPFFLLDEHRDHPAYRRLADRGAAIFVRQVLRPPGAVEVLDEPGERLKAGLALPAAANVVVGVSRLQHLQELLAGL